MSVKGKGKGQTSYAYAGTKGRRKYSSNAFLTFALEVGVWSAPLQETVGTRRLGGHRRRAGRMRKNLHRSEFAKSAKKFIAK